jgi:hypothetical protein
MSSERYISGTESDALRRFGIGMLTGEACALGERVLCDVTEEGLKLLELAFDARIKLGAPYNNSVNGVPPIGSLLIPNKMFHTLAVVALSQVPGTVEIWQYSNGDLRSMTREEAVKHRDDTASRHYKNLTQEEYEHWYKLREKWRSGKHMTYLEINQFRQLDRRQQEYCGVVKVYALAPHNNRGPAADATGLTHAKMM